MSIQCYPLSLKQQLSIQAICNGRPTTLRVQTFNGSRLALAAGQHFGFIWQGQAQLTRLASSVAFPLLAGMYFSLAEAAVLEAKRNKIHDEHQGSNPNSGTVGIVITQARPQSVMSQSATSQPADTEGILATEQPGRFTLGGPIQTMRRFAYINGGTTSLLIPPIVLGEPVLNALYMPPNVDQTMHTHPSDRIGLIIRGGGQCCTEQTCQDLSPGTVFHISGDQAHRFVTGNEGLDLVVFHPDSDLGFSDRHHPMLSRTFVNDVSATELPEIQTGKV